VACRVHCHWNSSLSPKQTHAWHSSGHSSDIAGRKPPVSILVKLTQHFTKTYVELMFGSTQLSTSKALPCSWLATRHTAQINTYAHCTTDRRPKRRHLPRPHQPLKLTLSSQQLSTKHFQLLDYDACGVFFYYLCRIVLQPVFHQPVYHGIFTEVSTDLECFTSVIQAVCYFEIVSGFGCINLVLEACGRYFWGNL
jgi:hypothetical protein